MIQQEKVRSLKKEISVLNEQVYLKSDTIDMLRSQVTSKIVVSSNKDLEQVVRQKNRIIETLQKKNCESQEKILVLAQDNADLKKKVNDSPS